MVYQREFWVRAGYSTYNPICLGPMKCNAIQEYQYVGVYYVSLFFIIIHTTQRYPKVYVCSD